MFKKKLLSVSMMVALVLILAVPAMAAPLQLDGAGASFPYPIYSKWFDEYLKVDPSVQINYQSIGSGAGIRQILAKTVDFGASDSPMTDAELAEADGEILHIPMVIGSTAVVYNIPGISSGLKLTGELLADIYLGKVTMWNDGRIAQLNPDLKLPKLPIVVVRRSDGSGTTFTFSDYLSSVSSEWAEKVGTGKVLKWPVGLGGKGNEGVAGLVRQLPGAIGYVEQAYAEQNNLSQAAMRNKSGNFVLPSLKGASLAAAGVEMPADYRVSIVNADGEEAYPIATFTWLLVYKDAVDEVKGRKLAEFIWWAIHDGGSYAEALHYAPLPEAVVMTLEDTLKELNYNGTPFLK